MLAQRQLRSAIVVALVSLVLLAGGCQGFGDRLLRTFLVFKEQPLTASVAASQGWYRLSSSCSPVYGYPYARDPSGPTSTSPVILYYTAAGQLSGASSFFIAFVLSLSLSFCYNWFGTIEIAR